MTKRLVIVDGYSSGSQLPAILNENGWKCIHVSSLANPPEYYLTTFSSDDYVSQFVYEGDIQELSKTISELAPAAVVPGTESGVIVADHLAEALGLPGNDPSTSIARRNKYEMINRIKSRGLRGPDCCLARDFDKLLAWAESGVWPIVVKPVASAGADSVTFCKNSEELESSFQRLLGSTNKLGEINDAVLAQRLLSGQEYMVNGVSGYGHHIITEIWRNDKIRVPGAGVIYDRIILFDTEDPAMRPIRDYVYQVIDALGVRYGASHTELMVTDQGPTLIECASRLSGGLCRPAANYGVGVSQLDLVANLVTEGEPYIDRLAGSNRRIKKPLWQVPFIASSSGTVVQTSLEKLIATVQSKVWIQRAPNPGDKIERTIDLFTSPGLLFMSHSDANVLQSDYETIREWEREDKIFKVEDC